MPDDPNQPTPSSTTPVAGGNVNSPASYAPSQDINAIAPVLAQITGGNAGNTLAGIQGAQGQNHSFFGDIGASISKVSQQLSTVFNIGQQVGKQQAVSSSPQAIAQKSQDLAVLSGQAALVGGQAMANVTAMDAFHAAAADAAKKADIVQLGLEPNSPEVVKANQNMAETAHQFNTHIQNVNQMKSVGFFDNPAEYLINHIVRLPIEEGRAKDAATTLKQESEAMVAGTTAQQSRSVIDDAYNTKNTNERAANLYVAAQAQAAQAALKPLQDAQQTQLSAWHLGVEQGQLGVAQGELALRSQENARQQALFPGQLKMQSEQIEYMGAAKQASLEQAKATALMRSQEAMKIANENSADVNNLADVNSLLKYVGAPGQVTDIKAIGSGPKLQATMEMAQNLKTFGQLASDPASAMRLLHASGLPTDNIASNHLPTLSYLDQSWSVAKDAIQTDYSKTHPGLRLSDQDLNDRAAAYMNAGIAKEQDNISSDNKFFQMPSVNHAVEAPWAKNNPIIQAMRPMAVDGNTSPITRPMDGSLLMNTAAQLVGTGKISAAQAATSLQSYAINTLNDVQTTLGFKRFGIGVQQKFPTTFNTGGVPGSSSATVDLMNTPDTLLKLQALIGVNKAAAVKTQMNAQPNAMFGNLPVR
jgi:hypothetical protein